MEKEITKSLSHGSEKDRPIFLCYRQVDGKRYARWSYDALREELDSAADGVEIYFDQTAPAVNDWQTIHGPALERARAILVICTPGLFSDQGSDDWVHRELDWWLKNRSTAPIIVDSTGEGVRWIPEKLKARWPNQQRVKLDPELWETASTNEITMIKRQVANQILGGVATSEVQVVHEDLERSKRQNKRLKLYATGLLILAVGLGLAVSYALDQSDIAKERTKEVVSSLKQNRALDMTISAVELSRKNPTQAIRMLENANYLSPENTTILKNAYEIYLNSHRFPFYYREIESSFVSPNIIVSPDNTRFIEIEDGRGDRQSDKGILREITGKKVGQIIVDNKEPESIQFFPLTNRIASLAEVKVDEETTQKKLLVYGFDGVLVNEFSPPDSYIEGFTISPHEDFILTLEKKLIGKDVKNVLVKRFLPDFSLDTEYQLDGSFVSGGFDWHPTKNMVVFSTYKNVVLLNLDTGSKVVQPILGVHTAAFSPSGSYFSAGSTKLKKGIVWDLEGNEIISIPHEAYVWSVNFSPDEKFVATASWDETIKISSIDGTQEKTLQNGGRTWFARFSDYADQILAVSHDQIGAKLWETNGNLQAQLESGLSINHGQYLKDSGEIITATEEGVKFWLSDGHYRALGKGRWLYRSNDTYAQINGNLHKYTDRLGEISFTYDFLKPVSDIGLSGQIAVVIVHQYDEPDDTKNRFKKPKSSEIFVFREHELVHRKKTEFAVFSPHIDKTAERFIVRCYDGKARLYDFSVSMIQEFSSKVPYHEDTIDKVTSARISSSTGQIVLATQIGFVRLFAKDGTTIEEGPLGIREDKMPTPTSYTGSTKTAVFSSSDKMIAVFPGESYFLIKDMESGKTRTITLKKDGGIHDLVYTGRFINDTELVIASTNRETTIWNARTSELVARLPRSMVFVDQSPDGSYLLMRKGDQTIEVVSPHQVFNWLGSAKVAPLNRVNREKFEVVDNFSAY